MNRHISPQRHELWYPGMQLDHEYPTPSSETLSEAWGTYTERSSIPTRGVLGAFAPPHGPIRAVASIDICEVLRDTAMAFDLAIGSTPRRRSAYNIGTWLEDSPREYGSTTICSVVQVVMNADHVQPVPEINHVRETLQAWRQAGIYCVANTATLPGCEIATITNLLSRHVRGGFDALVLPRNWDGTGQIKKAHALDILMQEVGHDPESSPLVHLDDGVHHVRSFVELFQNHGSTAYFVPLHSDNNHAPREMHCPDTATTFDRTTEFFKQQGVL